MTFADRIKEIEQDTRNGMYLQKDVQFLLDQLKAAQAREADLITAVEVLHDATGEVEGLEKDLQKANNELEELRKDAARYRYMRNNAAFLDRKGEKK